MRPIVYFLCIVVMVSCRNQRRPELTSQSIIDSSIAVSGGERYKNTIRSFRFRDRSYISEKYQWEKSSEKNLKNDTASIIDVLTNQRLQRYVNDGLVQLHDTLANKYANSVNSVHYFADLPYGLNDQAVNKELLGEATIKGKDYYKVKVTFDEEGGGDDFDDTYVYWFNKETFKPDYLAYEFHVDGGGMRFREAYNERYVNGIRFVDYNNYKTKDMKTPILKIDSLFKAGSLELLSKIELKEVQVSQGNYN